MKVAEQPGKSSPAQEGHKSANGLSRSISLLKRHNDARIIEAKRLTYVFYSSAILAGAIVIAFARAAFVQGDVHPLFLFCLIIASICMVGALIHALVRRDLGSAAFYTNLAIAALAAGLIITGGIQGTGLYWLAPLIYVVFISLGAKGGLFVSALLLSIIGIDIVWPDKIYADYSFVEARDALISLAALAFLCFIGEHFRYRSHQAISSQHTDKMLQSVTDPLTGLTNRRFLDSFYFPSCKLDPEDHFPLACVVCDIDHFKKVNDTYGHAAGDSVLKKVSKLLTENVRTEDVVSRIGGEEFLLLIQHVDVGVTRKIAEKMRAAIEALEPEEAGGRVTASFGISIATHYGDLDSVIEEADKCLYRAKESGRNMVFCDY